MYPNWKYAINIDSGISGSLPSHLLTNKQRCSFCSRSIQLKWFRRIVLALSGPWSSVPNEMTFSKLAVPDICLHTAPTRVRSVILFFACSIQQTTLFQRKRFMHALLVQFQFAAVHFQPTGNCSVHFALIYSMFGRMQLFTAKWRSLHPRTLNWPNK